MVATAGFMQVAIGPAHDNLNDIKQAVLGDAGWYHKTPPNYRFDIKQPDAYKQSRSFIFSPHISTKSCVCDRAPQ